MKTINQIDWSQINPDIYLKAAELITSHGDFESRDKELYACHAIARVLGFIDKNISSIYINIFALYFRDNSFGAWLDISAYMDERGMYFETEPSNQTIADNKILALLLMHQIAKKETAKFVKLKK